MVTLTSVRDRLRDCGVIPVVAIGRSQDAPALAQALSAAGLPCAEITFRTAAAGEAIERIRVSHPDVVVGGGTVLSLDQANRAIDAGAQFIVSPGLQMDVVETGLHRGIPVYPGVMTPTEIIRALDAGLTDLKFFPAESSGGTAHLRALAAPFPMVRFIPTGGIGPTNLAEYLAETSVLAVGGSWMVRPELLEAGDWAAVHLLAAEAVGIVRAVRGPAGGESAAEVGTA